MNRTLRWKQGPVDMTLTIVKEPNIYTVTDVKLTPEPLYPLKPACDVCLSRESDAGDYVRITGVAKGLRKRLCIPCAEIGVLTGRVEKVTS